MDPLWVLIIFYTGRRVAGISEPTPWLKNLNNWRFSQLIGLLGPANFKHIVRSNQQRKRKLKLVFLFRTFFDILKISCDFMSMHASIAFTKYCILKLRILVINYSYESDVKPSKFNILKNIATLHLYLFISTE